MAKINKILFKRSKKAGIRPTPAEMSEGELFINLADRVLLTKSGSNLIDLGFAKGGNVDGNINQVSGNFTTKGIVSDGSGRVFSPGNQPSWNQVQGLKEAGRQIDKDNFSVNGVIRSFSGQVNSYRTSDLNGVMIGLDVKNNDTPRFISKHSASDSFKWAALPNRTGTLALQEENYNKTEQDSRFIRIGVGGESIAFDYATGKHGYFTWKEQGRRTAYIGFPSDGEINFSISNENGGDVLVRTGSNKQLKVNGTPVVKQGDDGFHGGPSKILIDNEANFLTQARSGSQSTQIFRSDKTSIPGIPLYSPTLLLKAVDTWATLSVNYETGRLSTRAGNTSGSKNSPPKLMAFTDEIWDREESAKRFLRTPNSTNAIGVEQWLVYETIPQAGGWVKVAEIGDGTTKSQNSRYLITFTDVAGGFNKGVIHSFGRLSLVIHNGATNDNIAAKYNRSIKTGNVRIKQINLYKAEVWFDMSGYGALTCFCVSRNVYKPFTNVYLPRTSLPIGGSGETLTYDADISEDYNSDNISEIVSRIIADKQTIKSELGAPKFSLTSDLGGDTGGLSGKIQGGSWASWSTRPAMLEVQATINNGASSIWKLRSPTGEVVAALGGYSTNGAATGAVLQLRWGGNVATYNPGSLALTCDIVTDKLFRGNQTVLSGDGGVRAYFVSSSDNSNYFAFHNKGGTDISSRTAYIGFGTNDTTSFTIRNDKADKYLAIGNTLTFNGTQVLDKNHITQTFGVQTDLVPSVKIVKDGLDNRYSKSESDARFVNTNETNLGKNATALTTIPSGGWGKPVGYSVMVSQASTGKPPNTTNHGYWHVIAARDTAGGYAGFYTDYVDGRVFYGRAQAKTDNPSWYKVYTEASKPTPAEIGAYTKAESDSRVNRIGNDTFLRNSNGSKWLSLLDEGSLSLYDNSTQKRSFFASNTGEVHIYGRGYLANYPALKFIKEDGYYAHVEAALHSSSSFMTFAYRDSKNANQYAINMPKKNGTLAIASEHYTKGEVDSRVNVKANSADVWQKGQTYSRAESYSRSEVDSRVNVKANSADVYKKSDTYSKSEAESTFIKTISKTVNSISGNWDVGSTITIPSDLRGTNITWIRANGWAGGAQALPCPLTNGDTQIVFEGKVSAWAILRFRYTESSTSIHILSGSYAAARAIYYIQS